jgi:hypothetical protein
MANYVKKANIFGRIGENLGKGLAEQIPKEVEHQRRKSDLQGLANDSDKGNLSPAQFLARAAGAYGSTPQTIQSFGELAKQQQLRKAYKRGGVPGQEYQQANIESSPNFSNLESVKFAQMPGQIERNSQQQNQQTIPSNQTREKEALSNPGAASENPLNEKFIPTSPWNSQRDEQAINEAFDRGLATNFPEARAYADKQKELYQNAPEEYRKQLDYKKGVDQEVDNLFDKQLETRLQKEGKETFSDIPGDLQLKIKKKARNSVATGKMTPQQAAEYYSTKALDLAKSKGQALKIANRDLFDRLLPHKKEESLKNLQQIAEKYTDMGADEDFYNFLTTDKLSEDGKQEGMGLSPGGAAIIQYKRTPKVKSLIKNTKISSENPSKSTRNFTQNLFKEITPNDSFLAIARQMKQQDPNFDEYAFFDYLRENKGQYGSIDRLDREVVNGVSDFFPNWRDIGLFPALSKSVAND